MKMFFSVLPKVACSLV